MRRRELRRARRCARLDHAHAFGGHFLVVHALMNQELAELIGGQRVIGGMRGCGLEDVKVEFGEDSQRFLELGRLGLGPAHLLLLWPPAGEQTLLASRRKCGDERRLRASSERGSWLEIVREIKECGRGVRAHLEFF